MFIQLIAWFDVILAVAIAAIACVYAARARTRLALALAVVAVLNACSRAVVRWWSQNPFAAPVWVTTTTWYGSMIFGALLVTLLAFVLLGGRNLTPNKRIERTPQG